MNQRLVGEIHLDEFDVSHTKDILWLGDQEEKVQAGLKRCCTDYREIANSYRKSRDDSRGCSLIETSAAIDELRQELASAEMVDAVSVSVIPPQSVVEESTKSIVVSIVKSQQEIFTGNIGGISVRLFVIPTGLS